MDGTIADGIKADFHASGGAVNIAALVRDRFLASSHPSTSISRRSVSVQSSAVMASSTTATPSKREYTVMLCSGNSC